MRGYLGPRTAGHIAHSGATAIGIRQGVPPATAGHLGGGSASQLLLKPGQAARSTSSSYILRDIDSKPLDQPKRSRTRCSIKARPCGGSHQG